MKFAIVRPRERKVDVVNVPDAKDATIIAGLDPDHTDHGTIDTIHLWLGYVCDEYAMFEHPQCYFSIGRTLMAGNVVLFAFDAVGRTVDFNLPPYLWGGTWIGDEAAVEAAIKADKIDRPRLAAEGDEVFWQWPAPKPDMKAWAEKVAALMKKGPVQIDDTIIMAIPDDKKE